MSFYKENKLLISLLIAIVALGIVTIGMVSAQMTITKAKSTDTAYWDIPKAESPNIIAHSRVNTPKGAELPYIDPIVKDRERIKRGGIPSPTDIFNQPGAIFGIGSDALPDEIRRRLPDGKIIPTTPFAEMFDPDSPWDYQGRPGRLGDKKKVKMANYFDALEKGELETVDPIPEPSNDPSLIPFGEKRTADVDINSLRRAFSKLFMTVIAARQDAGAAPFTPLEGVLEDDPSENTE